MKLHATSPSFDWTGQATIDNVHPGLEAEKEIDDKYVMNDRDVDSPAERAEIEEKVQRVLAAYGLADLSTAALLGKCSHAMKKLSSRSVAGR